MGLHGLETDAGPFGRLPKQGLLFVGGGPELHGVGQCFTDVVVHVGGPLQALVMMAQGVLEFFPGPL
jgi:hypothetical protein